MKSWSSPDSLAVEISDVWNDTPLHKLQKGYISHEYRLGFITHAFWGRVGCPALRFFYKRPARVPCRPHSWKGDHPAHPTGEEHKLREVEDLPQITQLWMMGTWPSLPRETHSKPGKKAVLQKTAPQNTSLWTRDVWPRRSDSRTFVECWQHEYLNISVF